MSTSKILETTRDDKSCDWSSKFLEIVNMGTISFKKHEMQILEFFNSIKGIPHPHPIPIHAPASAL